MAGRSSRARILASERGMMLVQVILLSGVLLALVYNGFKSVQTTMQSANHSASSAAFQDYLLLIRQHLAVSEDCLTRLGASTINTVNAKKLMDDPLFSVPVSVRWDDGQFLAKVETGTDRAAPEFKVKEIVITNFLKIGRDQAGASADNGYQPTERYVGHLMVVAERRSQIMGGAEMRGTIDLLFQTRNSGMISKILSCSIRTAYMVKLGPTPLPSGIREKSGLECIDRGGTPVLFPGQPGYICRFPTSSMMLCPAMNGNVHGPGKHSEGWFCDEKITKDYGNEGKEASYGY